MKCLHWEQFFQFTIKYVDLSIWWDQTVTFLLKCKLICTQLQIGSLLLCRRMLYRQILLTWELHCRVRYCCTKQWTLLCCYDVGISIYACNVHLGISWKYIMQMWKILQKIHVLSVYKVYTFVLVHTFLHVFFGMRIIL